MDIQNIPVITVSYNSAELIDELLSSFRTYYRNPVYVIDGSGAEFYKDIETTAARYADVKFIHFDYNIHHGPGMAWAIENLDLSGPVLVIDSDVFVLKGGFLESLYSHLKPEMYGVGSVSFINEGGYDVDYENGAIPYLHPACMLVNLEVVKQWPLPVKHGAPMTPTMIALHKAGRRDLLGSVQWVIDDFANTETRHYLRHDWQGTVKRTGGYHLEEWEKASREQAITRLIIQGLVPATAKRLVEIGGGDGALTRVLKESKPGCHVISVGMDPAVRTIDKTHCDAVRDVDVDSLGDSFFHELADTDCWLLDKSLERVKRPDLLLQKIRKVVHADGAIVACIPNIQHWSIQAKIAIGDFRYAANGGLMDQAHLRWFSRATMFELFQKARFQIVQGSPVIHNKLENKAVLEAIAQFARSVGADPDLAVEDSQPEYYIVKAIPV